MTATRTDGLRYHVGSVLCADDGTQPGSQTAMSSILAAIRCSVSSRGVYFNIGDMSGRPCGLSTRLSQRCGIRCSGDDVFVHNFDERDGPSRLLVAAIPSRTLAGTVGARLLVCITS